MKIINEKRVLFKPWVCLFFLFLVSTLYAENPKVTLGIDRLFDGS